MTASRQQTALLWFAAPLVAVYAAAFFVIDMLPRSSAPGAVAVGLTVDLVLLIPALFYVVLVRGRGWPTITVAPAVLLSYGAASLVVPPEHQALLGAVGYALPAVELALVGYVGVKAWRVIRANRQASAAGGDFYDRVRETLRGAFDGPTLAGAFAYEASLAHYAFAVQRAEAPEHGLAYHKRSGYGAIFAAVLMAAALELVALHFLLRAWSETAALVHAGLSLYGLVWLVGDYRAMRHRPHELRADGLRLRYGLRWDLAVPWDQVLSVQRTRRARPGNDYLNMVPVGSPRYVVELRGPAEATGLYGISREVRYVGIVVDEMEAFETRLRELGMDVQG